jgi:hypothetical protein
MVAALCADADDTTDHWRESGGSSSERLYMDAPWFAMRSFRDGLKEQIAPVHPDFVCGICRCP